MRDFFKSELENLHVKTGSQQLFKLMEMSDHNGQSIGQQKVKMLLDGLEMAASEFNYIPEDDKKRIIQRAIIRDPNFVTNGGLTPRFVWQSLNVEASKYFKEEAHRPTEQKEIDPSLDPTPKSFDELSSDRQKEVIDLLNKLMQPSKFKVPQASQKEIDDLRIEDLESQEGKKSIAPVRPEWIVGDICPNCEGNGVIWNESSSIECSLCFGVGEINLVKVHADSEAEARKAYKISMK